MDWTSIIISAISQGVIWSMMALGVYVSFRLLDFPDMTVDGSFTCGAAISAVMILNGYSPLLTLVVAIIGGSLAGLITAFFNTKLGIPALLAGILTQIALYSINLRIMQDRPNLPLLKTETIFTQFQNLTGLSQNASTLVIALLFAFLLISLLYWFFGTELGSIIRASGINPQLVRSQGFNTKLSIIIGLMIANALTAFSGAILAQSQGFADLQMGTGAIVIGLAAIIIGEVIITKPQFFVTLSSVVLGSVIYRIIIAFVLYLGLRSRDLKLFTALFVALSLYLPGFITKQKRLKQIKSIQNSKK